MARPQFEALVDRSLDEIPDQIVALVDNVVVLVEDDPPADEPGLLGLYDGVALTERQAHHAMELPDRILIARHPLLDMSGRVEELQDAVRITVVQGIAPHDRNPAA